MMLSNLNSLRHDLEVVSRRFFLDANVSGVIVGLNGSTVDRLCLATKSAINLLSEVHLNRGELPQRIRQFKVLHVVGTRDSIQCCFESIQDLLTSRGVRSDCVQMEQ
jgi:hypothetical protein